eukprot:CAMPEP_0170484638 /NCGR_PEP_ID=MMETSP0208-20121228/4053_1 /TAXON_ID=197538 /ORGANISM="Strombidium inclinatum, Strain S3" /LENGTH=52 /DNA_ID=CAMNT_0010758011 /DNA_START=1 /DNA_END=156 /DNA_ORIENTATION=-
MEGHKQEVLQPLFEFQRKYNNQLAIVNTECVASILHLNIAVSRALIAHRDSK